MYHVNIFEKRMKKIEPKLDNLINLVKEYHVTRNLTAATEAADLLYDLLINEEVQLEVLL